MFFLKKTLPDGSPQKSESDYDYNMDRTYHTFRQESAWAVGYMELLEKHLSERLKRCKECPYRNQEGSGCNDKIPD